MFDAFTVDLIGEAPTFGDLDLSELPKSLTDDYTKIVSLRLSINERALANDEYENLIAVQTEARKIALTYEAYLAGSLTSNQRLKRAAAFVSASAHQVWTMIENMRVSSIIETSYLQTNFIHPNLSCALLFFISGYTADAAEVAKSLQTNDNSETTEIYLIKNLKNLLVGRVTSPISSPMNFPENSWGEAVAIEALWKIINNGLVTLINILSGEPESDDISLTSAIASFNLAKELSTFTSEIQVENHDFSVASNFAGPRHLSVLLLALTEEISDIALVKISVPNQINPQAWLSLLREFAKKRPYLWPNHLEAIRSGYLELGTSAVMSFPTGGGKSTLAELKIAVALQNGMSVIFIAPTLALVDQISRNLKEAFPTVKTMFDLSELGLEAIELETLPDISVMTPESCLVRMSFNPELFTNVGLFIFDECHLLHPKSEESVDRRSIDSMLCLIHILEISPETDILLMSAMMKNSEEIAHWIHDISGKTTLPLNISWKPTRQAKGCIVYESERVQELKNFIEAAPKTPSGRLTAASKRELTAIPFSFFSLNQTWHSNHVEDYRMVKLLSTEVTLGISNENYLTSNKNHVASQIAHQADINQIKTLIFTDTKKNCDSFINNNFDRPSPLNLTQHEQILFDLISTEFGDQSFTYVSQNTTYLPHHGLLTKLERSLHESIFKRKDGVNVIVATSTLAQGINLPAELVIISGNTRYDAEANQQQEIQAHDLLNAAGRAGRAGESAKGIVLVIPSQLVSFNSRSSVISRFFINTVKQVFSETDQCLDIQDPIKIILDKIHNNPEVNEANISYFIERIPTTPNGDSSPFMFKTFGAYQARVRNDEEWIATRIESANSAFRRIRNLSEDREPTWHDKLAAASGIPAQMIHDLANDLAENINMIQDFDSALTRLFVWLSESAERVTTILRSGSIDEVFGSEYTELTNEEKQNFFLTTLLTLCFQWVRPQSLSAIEASINGDANNLGKCDKARRFSLRLIPELAYSAGIFSQVYLNLLNEIDPPQPSILAVEMMSQLLKNGFNDLRLLAFHNFLKKSGEVTRMNTYAEFLKIIPFIIDADDPNDFNSIRLAVEASYQTYIGE